ncbi:DUF2259 domain-containing protein [Aestuariivirga litoralis]|uniref:DUF2259 domain-containing protein n=1 Tax=Aestuariivirga litoralis TaxID=2650924 RepID=UPI0018C7973E|nr:DUF2259 domain-containing protein [Aestuariivirga litoralis]MBG1233036.1 DUF2259 domain-containing protein [Aestuariivirga litoralis]
MMLKSAGLALALCLASATPSFAGDGAELNILGFSADSRYFAFEQFGEQDGSGYAFDEIFVVDLTKDAWVKDSPIRVLGKDDEKLGVVMQQARAKYAALEKTYAITSPVRVLARSPVYEVIEDRKTITFDTWYMSSEFGSTPDVPDTLKEVRYVLSVAEKPLPRPSTCPEDMGDDYKGFTLKLKSIKDGSERELVSDAAIPNSRGCPFGYDVQAVVDGFSDTQTDQVVAILGVYSLGFEGKDLRYMAVPFKLKP